MVVHEGWTAQCTQPSGLGRAALTLTRSQAWEHTHDLTFRQGVRCIEISPPFHLI